MRILLLLSLMLLAACAAPQNNSGMKAAEPPPAMAVEQKPDVEQKEAVAAPPHNVAVEEKTTDGKPGEVNFSCNKDSDCKIKDVGSCCGYRPACVNKDSKTFPAEVKAECAKKGMAGICGFPSISSCTCTNNKCEGVTGGAGGMAEEKIQ
ncbi:MAG: hypothetical protein ACREO1_08905 [Arenimonas sp.]